MNSRTRISWLCCCWLAWAFAGLAVGQQQTVLSQSDQRLSVLVGRSLVVTSSEPLGRVSVTDPEVASAVIITETQLLIHGLKPGSITLLLWNQQDQLQSFDLQVQLDVGGARESLRQAFPGENIEVRQSGESLVLTGAVASDAEAEQAGTVANTYAPGVVNLLSVRENREVVLLQVRIAEVDRGALQELGVSIFSTGLGNLAGSTSTQQFGNLGASAGELPQRVQPPPGNPVAGTIGRGNEGFASVFGLSDLMNIFLFRPDLNLGTVVRALNQRNLLEILAEPNIIAINGSEASFLAGGEFPFPVVQAGAAGNAVTIQFREFGVRVNFTPQVQEDGLIRLKVAPEVSALDFANALTIAGFVVPAISSRKAETEVELRNGQSFAIAGLIDNRTIEVASKIPGLGDIPLLGHLFRSRSTERTNTELLVIVTPQLVQPSDNLSQIPQPNFPKDLLDKKEFDSKTQKPNPKPQPPPEG